GGEGEGEAERGDGGGRCHAARGPARGGGAGGGGRGEAGGPPRYGADAVYSPSAAAKRSSACTFAGSGASPVKPAPITCACAATERSVASTSATDGPFGSGMNTERSDGSSTSQSSAT